MPKSVAFIGKPDGLELHIDNQAGFEQILGDIKEKLNQGGSHFFEGASSIHVLGRFTPQQKSALRELLQEGYGFSHILFEGEKRSHAPIPSTPVPTVAKRREPTPIPDALAQKRDATPEWGVLSQEPARLDSNVQSARESSALTVSETVRSGQSVAYDGDIVILGDVNRGAEIVATGNIVVMGVLRGVAHAGCAGDHTATVTANLLLPQQLRIAEHVALAPEDSSQPNQGIYPEQAKVLDERIVISHFHKRPASKRR